LELSICEISIFELSIGVSGENSMVKMAHASNNGTGSNFTNGKVGKNGTFQY